MSAPCVRCSPTGTVPDAVFAASDLMAVGALRVLREAGLRVPDDVALVGFDDSAVSRHTQPTLTSVHQPVEEMGRVMADLLLARIAGEPVPRETVLPHPARAARLGLGVVSGHEQALPDKGIGARRGRGPRHPPGGRGPR